MQASRVVNIIKKRWLLYIGLVLVVIGWVLYGCLLLLENNTNRLLSANNAKTVEAVSQVRALPQPKDITYGQTSSNLAEVTAKYTAAADQLANEKPESMSIFTTKPGKLTNVKSLNTKVNAEIDSLQESLKRSAEVLIVLQKFLEYDPATDLQPYATGAEADASERLNRTQEGMVSITTAVSNKSWYYKKDIIDLITPLSKKITMLTPSQVAQWNDEVNAAQKKITDIIQAEYSQSIKQSLDKLEEYSPTYLSL